jgi:hypothetical protein
MLSDVGDESFNGEDFKTLLVVPMSHGRATVDLAGILDIVDLLLREGVSQDVFDQCFLSFPIVSGYAVSGMYAEAAVAPTQQLYDELVAYFAIALQHS